MAQYLMSVHHPDGYPDLTPEEMQPVFEAVGAFNEELQAQGKWVFAGGLQPQETATVLQVVDGEVVVTDGPYAETKEQLLGFYVVDCKNLDEALDVARDLAAANPGGAYEIRPVGLFRPGSLPS